MNNVVTSLLIAICLTATSGQVLAAQSSGIVRSAAKAPIVPDGDVAGSRTDFVIDLYTD